MHILQFLHIFTFSDKYILHLLYALMKPLGLFIMIRHLEFCKYDVDWISVVQVGTIFFLQQKLTYKFYSIISI